MSDNEQKAKSADKNLFIKNIIAVNNGFSDWGQFLRVDPDEALNSIDAICDLVVANLQSQNEKLVKENQELREAAESALYVAKRYDRGKYGHIIDNVEQALKK